MFDTSKVHDALLLVADHVDQNPEKFDYWSPVVPTGANEVGCYVGHLGLALGFEPGTTVFSVSARTGVTENDIYRRWREQFAHHWEATLASAPKSEVAKTLRLIAEEEYSK